PRGHRRVLHLRRRCGPGRRGGGLERDHRRRRLRGRLGRGPAVRRQGHPGGPRPGCSRRRLVRVPVTGRAEGGHVRTTDTMPAAPDDERTDDERTEDEVAVAVEVLTDEELAVLEGPDSIVVAPFLATLDEGERDAVLRTAYRGL